MIIAKYKNYKFRKKLRRQLIKEEIRITRLIKEKGVVGAFLDDFEAVIPYENEKTLRDILSIFVNIVTILPEREEFWPVLKAYLNKYGVSYDHIKD